jgi:predicted acylesterase/phospholipase RssA
MKKKKHIVFYSLVVLAVASVFILRGERRSCVIHPDFSERQGTAIIMTGAAARIPQEAALLEELQRRGLLKDVVFISGVSSGSLNAVMLNAILTGKMSWYEYKGILYNIKNENIYTQNDRKLPVNTTPFRNLLEQVVEKRLGYHTIGDLPITTEISFVRLKPSEFKKTVYRMCSRKINAETDTTLNLVDIMMASSAFPIVFPPVRISNASTIPDADYIDGGVGDDHVPYKALLEFEKMRGVGVKRVYIISRQNDSIPRLSEELANLGINDRGLFDRQDINLDNVLKKGILNRLKSYAREAPDLVPRTYVWLPDYNRSFLFFNFDSLKIQYETTSKWARTHDPVPLSEYLLPYLLGKN